MRLQTTLEIYQHKEREKCIKQSEEGLASLNEIFQDVFHAISETLEPIWNNYKLMTTSNWEGEGDLLLIGSGLQGIDNREKFESILSAFSIALVPTKNLIYEGCYVQSSTLLRSNIEILTQLRKILDKKYKDKVTPRVTSLDIKMRKVYGKLTGIAHTSNSELLSEFTRSDGDLEGLVTPLLRTLTPYFNTDLGQILFSLHIIISIETIFLIDEYLDAHIPDDKVLKTTIKHLKDYKLTIWADYLQTWINSK